MNTVTVSPYHTIRLGRQGENLATVVVFDVSGFRTNFGDGHATLVHKRSGDKEPYPVSVAQINDNVCWIVRDGDLAKEGIGECELQWIVNKTLAKSITYKTLVLKSISKSESDEDPAKPWYQQIEVKLAAIFDKITSLKATDISMEDGKSVESAIALRPEARVVTELPEDAAEHPDILYLILEEDGG